MCFVASGNGGPGEKGALQDGDKWQIAECDNIGSDMKSRTIFHAFRVCPGYLKVISSYTPQMGVSRELSLHVS